MIFLIGWVGQIEIDEIYTGVNNDGKQCLIPVQANSGSDKLGVVQTLQGIACCKEKYPHFICRPISAQFMKNGVIALFELEKANGEIQITQEKHYQLKRAAR